MFLRKTQLVQWLILFIAAAAACSCGDDDDSTSSGQAGDDEADDTADDSGIDDTSPADDDGSGYVVPPYPTTAPPWPEWVLRPWVWEDESTQESATQYVQDYLDNDIPVGAVIIDSPWETGYNTFEFDPALFPDPQSMVDFFHENGVRVFLWTTANVNTDSPNFQEGLDNGYYVNGGRTLEWWKGDGAFIDYWNPDALAWWHAQMDNVLDLGIDGWKTDGSEFSLYLWLYLNTADGPKLPHEYQAAYYSDFFNYSRERLGPDRVITARPVDSYGVPWGPSFAPVDVNFAGWVGDQDPTFNGMMAALLNMFMSGNRSYVNFGSDISGYREDIVRDKALYVRWAQLGAFCPIMENGGGGEHRPWMYDEEVLGLYRDFAKLHTALIPYLYSQGATSYQNRVSLFRPYSRTDWEYFLGDSLLVAAMTSPGTSREVKFPEGTWTNWFTGEEYIGPTTVAVDVPLGEFPVFVKRGAIIPMDIREGGAFNGDAGGNPPFTVLIHPEEGRHVFFVYAENGDGGRVEYTGNGTALDLKVSAQQRDFAFRVRMAAPPASVTADPAGTLASAASLADLASSETGYFFDTAAGELWIKTGDASKGVSVSVE